MVLHLLHAPRHFAYPIAMTLYEKVLSVKLTSNVCVYIIFENATFISKWHIQCKNHLLSILGYQSKFYRGAAWDSQCPKQRCLLCPWLWLYPAENRMEMQNKRIMRVRYFHFYFTSNACPNALSIKNTCTNVMGSNNKGGFLL